MEKPLTRDEYRGDLSAAFARIAFLEHELSLFRSDPAHERVDVAEEDLARAKRRRQYLQRLLPKVLILSFVCMGAYALTDPSLPAAIAFGAIGICVLGAAAGLVSLTGLLVLLAQGERPARIVELERNVRLAKADVGVRRARVRVRDPFELQAQAELDEEFPTEAERRRAV